MATQKDDFEILIESGIDIAVPPDKDEEIVQQKIEEILKTDPSVTVARVKKVWQEAFHTNAPPNVQQKAAEDAENLQKAAARLKAHDSDATFLQFRKAAEKLRDDIHTLMDITRTRGPQVLTAHPSAEDFGLTVRQAQTWLDHDFGRILEREKRQGRNITTLGDALKYLPPFLKGRGISDETLQYRVISADITRLQKALEATVGKQDSGTIHRALKQIYGMRAKTGPVVTPARTKARKVTEEGGGSRKHKWKNEKKTQSTIRKFVREEISDVTKLHRSGKLIPDFAEKMQDWIREFGIEVDVADIKRLMAKRENGTSAVTDFIETQNVGPWVAEMRKLLMRHGVPTKEWQGVMLEYGPETRQIGGVPERTRVENALWLLRNRHQYKRYNSRFISEVLNTFHIRLDASVIERNQPIQVLIQQYRRTHKFPASLDKKLFDLIMAEGKEIRPREDPEVTETRKVPPQDILGLFFGKVFPRYETMIQDPSWQIEILNLEYWKAQLQKVGVTLPAQFIQNKELQDLANQFNITWGRDDKKIHKKNYQQFSQKLMDYVVSFGHVTDPMAFDQVGEALQKRRKKDPVTKKQKRPPQAQKPAKFLDAYKYVTEKGLLTKEWQPQAAVHKKTIDIEWADPRTGKKLKASSGVWGGFVRKWAEKGLIDREKREGTIQIRLKQAKPAPVPQPTRERKPRERKPQPKPVPKRKEHAPLDKHQHDIDGDASSLPSLTKQKRSPKSILRDLGISDKTTRQETMQILAKLREKFDAEPKNWKIRSEIMTVEDFYSHQEKRTEISVDDEETESADESFEDELMRQAMKPVQKPSPKAKPKPSIDVDLTGPDSPQVVHETAAPDVAKAVVTGVAKLIPKEKKPFYGQSAAEQARTLEELKKKSPKRKTLQKRKKQPEPLAAIEEEPVPKKPRKRRGQSPTQYGSFGSPDVGAGAGPDDEYVGPPLSAQPPRRRSTRRTKPPPQYAVEFQAPATVHLPLAAVPDALKTKTPPRVAQAIIERDTVHKPLKKPDSTTPIPAPLSPTARFDPDATIRVPPSPFFEETARFELPALPGSPIAAFPDEKAPELGLREVGGEEHDELLEQIVQAGKALGDERIMRIKWTVFQKRIGVKRQDFTTIAKAPMGLLELYLEELQESLEEPAVSESRSVSPAMSVASSQEQWRSDVIANFGRMRQDAMSTGTVGRRGFYLGTPRRRLGDPVEMGSVGAHFQSPLQMQARRVGGRYVPGVQQLMADRFRPVGYNPERHYSGFVFAKQLPGDYFEQFKETNRQLDPMAQLLCGGRKQEIGDNIQLCMAPKEVHVIIYRQVSLKAMDVLCKKLLYHVRQQPGTTVLSEFDRGVLYDSKALRKKTYKKLASELFALVKKRKRFLKLTLTQSHQGGALHEKWMHRPDALRRISRAVKKNDNYRGY